jgi:hypothetical protein
MTTQQWHQTDEGRAWMRAMIRFDMVRRIAEHCARCGWAFQYAHYIILGKWPRKA